MNYNQKKINAIKQMNYNLKKINAIKQMNYKKFQIEIYRKYKIMTPNCNLMNN